MNLDLRLQGARQLIRQKEYERARRLLYNIDDPQAKHLLAQLDKFAPPDEKPKRKEKEKNDNWDDEERLPHGEPMNPRKVFAISWLIHVSLSAIILSFNWKRLGKSWFFESFLLALLLPVVTVLCVVGVIVFSNRNPSLAYPLTILGVACGAMCFAYAIAVSTMQDNAIQQWHRQGVRAMLEHVYHPMQWAVGVLGFGIIIAAAFVFLFPSLIPVPRTFESEHLSLVFESDWYYFQEYCESGATFTTLVCLMNGTDNSYSRIFIVVHRDNVWNSPAQMEESKRGKFLLESPTYVVTNLTPTTVDGQPAFIRDSQELGIQCGDVVRQVYWFYEGHAYQLTAEASCEREWNENIWDIERMTANIRMK